MSLGRLLLRNLLYHWRGNLAVLLGVALGTAVLTGALLVGDSLRGSLRQRTLSRLEWVDQALVTGRLFRAILAEEVREYGGARRVVPAMLLQATGEGKNSRRVPRVNVVGVRNSFWPEGTPGPEDGHVWLNDVLAAELGAAVGDKIKLRLQRPSTGVPRESLLGKRDAGAELREWEVTVGRVLGEGDPGGRFSLHVGLDVPRNAFVALEELTTELGVGDRANALLAAGVNDTLPTVLRQRMELEDWGLVLHDAASRADLVARRLRAMEGDHPAPEPTSRPRRELKKGQKFILGRFASEQIDADKDDHATDAELTAFYQTRRPYLSLESLNLMLEPAIATAALEAAKETGLRAAPTLIYLADRIQPGEKAAGPGEKVADAWDYVIVAALDPAQAAPLGPFLPQGVDRLGDDEIVLAQWDDSPFRANKGDPVTLSYFEPKEQGRLVYNSRTFKLAGTVPLKGATADADLTPEFPGITDKMTLTEWEPPFEKRSTDPREERFWEQYRTVPRAYVTLKTGQELWGSRFGDLTSIRLAPRTPGEGGDLSKVKTTFENALKAKLDPEKGGFVFEAVRERGLEASSGFMDFGGLFLGFSFFLIAAALLLVGLLFRLNLDRRASEVGLLLATGYRPSTVRWLLVGEGGVLAVFGGLIGLLGAVVYAAALLELLRGWWPGGLDRSFLTLHAGPGSFAIGYFSALLVSLLTILWAVRVLKKAQPRALLAGVTGDEAAGGRVRCWGWPVAGILLLGAVGCLIAGVFVKDAQLMAFSFFGCGGMLLAAGLSAVWGWMRGDQRGTFGRHGWAGLVLLGVRNAGRHPVRSLLTVGLLASATFLVVAVKSFHRDAGADFHEKKGGSGGFPMLVETDLPLYQDPNSEKGRQELITRLEEVYQEATKGGPEKERLLGEASADLKAVTLMPFRLKAGDDASCLNLYQPKRPRMLGVPRELVKDGGFHFAATLAASPTENPWLLLEDPKLLKEPLPDGVIPVFGEANSVQYNLHSGLGGDIKVPNEQGEEVTLRFVGLLHDSVFQGEVLMSEANFLKLYPRQEGYRFFLVDVPPERMDAVAGVLQTALDRQGATVTDAKRRVESFLAVENTYLATFQALGGLALLLGALGLAVVLLRSVWERRRELALLRALGYRRSALGWLVLAETAFLLVLGLAIGSLTAVVSVSPQLLSGAGQIPVPALFGLLGLVLAVGLAAAAAAVATTLRAPLLPALRGE